MDLLGSETETTALLQTDVALAGRGRSQLADPLLGKSYTRHDHKKQQWVVWTRGRGGERARQLSSD